MKSLIAVLSLLCIITTFQAQEDKEYVLNNVLNKITIQIEDNFYIGYSRCSKKNWRASQGGFEISEDKLYSMAGFSEQCNKAIAYRRCTNRLLWGSIIATLIGGVTTLIGSYKIASNSELNSDYTIDQYNQGIIMTCIGAVPFTIGVCILVTLPLRPTKWAPASFALEAAEYYNKNLRR